MLLAHLKRGNVWAGGTCVHGWGGYTWPHFTIDLLPFDYKSNHFEIHLNNTHQKLEIASNFTKEIRLKINRTKKKFTTKLTSPSVIQKK